MCLCTKVAAAGHIKGLCGAHALLSAHFATVQTIEAICGKDESIVVVVVVTLFELEASSDARRSGSQVAGTVLGQQLLAPGRQRELGQHT